MREISDLQKREREREKGRGLKDLLLIPGRKEGTSL
jgi:hypothetical protein